MTGFALYPSPRRTRMNGEQSVEPECGTSVSVQTTGLCRTRLTVSFAWQFDMITRAEAERIAAKQVAVYANAFSHVRLGLALFPDATLEYEFGWLFFYDSTDPRRYPIAGNAPFIVDRASGTVVETGIARSIDYNIENYRRLGTTRGQGGCNVQLLGYSYGANTIAAIKAVREYTSLLLKESKDSIEACMVGKAVVVTARTDGDAVALVAALKSCLFAAEQLP